MKLLHSLSIATLILAVNALTKRGADDAVALPGLCLKQNGIGIGWLPDDDNGYVLISTITDKIGAACYYGLYSHFGADLSVLNSDVLGQKITDVKNSGAVFVLSMMPTKVAFGSIDSAVANQVAQVVKQYTDQGITVLLRFAHEFNWYATDGTYSGSASDFKKAWANIASAVKSNSKVKMYWSPNIADASSLAQWWPEDDSTVDVVGLDAYKTKDADTFDSFYKSFYQAFSVGKGNKPFVIGETGTITESYKADWLKTLADQPSYANYQGFSWFEYNKASEGDFRVVTGSSNIAKLVLNGSSASNKSYGNSTVSGSSASLKPSSASTTTLSLAKQEEVGATTTEPGSSDFADSSTDTPATSSASDEAAYSETSAGAATTVASEYPTATAASGVSPVTVFVTLPASTVTVTKERTKNSHSKSVPVPSTLLTSITSDSYNTTKASSSAESSGTQVSSTGSFTGRGTYYYPSDDNCGSTSSADDNVVALSMALYGSGDHCGKYINALYQGKTVKVKVVDSCESCAYYDLDFSPAAFKSMADLDIGVLQVTWEWA